MKRYILVIVALCLCLIICGCTSGNANNAGGSGETSNLTIESMREYNKMLKSTKLPTNFVEYSQISQLGEFESVVFLSDTSSGDYSSYMYNLVDSTGYAICLYVEPLEEKDTTADTDSIIAEVDRGNMRVLSQNTKGVYVTNGITYKYVSGKLLSVSWSGAGLEYKLCGLSMLYDYPADSSTFVGKLMSLDNAAGAVNSVFTASSDK